MTGPRPPRPPKEWQHPDDCTCTPALIYDRCPIHGRCICPAPDTVHAACPSHGLTVSDEAEAKENP